MFINKASVSLLASLWINHYIILWQGSAPFQVHRRDHGLFTLGVSGVSLTWRCRPESWIPFRLKPGCDGELGDEVIVVRAKTAASRGRTWEPSRLRSRREVSDDDRSCWYQQPRSNRGLLHCSRKDSADCHWAEFTARWPHLGQVNDILSEKFGKYLIMIRESYLKHAMVAQQMLTLKKAHSEIP